MNSLSWVIYFGSLANSLIGLFIATTVAGAGAIATTVIAGASMRDDSYKGKERWQKGLDLQKKALKFIPFLAVPVLLVIVIPSKETIYMIAASQVGEKAVQTPEFTKVREIINNYLDNELHPPKQEDSK